MAKSILPLLNEMFEEIPVQLIPTSTREQIKKALDINYEKLNAEQRHQLLNGACSILGLVSLIREQNGHKRRIAFLIRMLSKATSEGEASSAPEPRPILQSPLNQQIKKAI